MADGQHDLPDDVTALKAMVRHYRGEVAQRDAQLEAKAERINELQAQVRQLLAHRFGARSEKVSEAQLGLFNEAELEAHGTEQDECTEANDTSEVPAHRRRRGKRRPLPEHLVRQEIIHDLAPEEKVCPHDDTPLECIDAVCTEQLDIIPAKVQVLVHKRLKYACPCCREHMATAPLPPQPIPKSQASPGLLAYVATAKYVDALPLYRQSTQFARLGIDMARHTLARWIVKMGGSDGVMPLINVLRDEMHSQTYLQMDETTFQVLKEPGRAPQSKSQLWVQRAMDPQRPILLFTYAASRSSKVATELIGDFQGVLQTDGYRGYDGPVREGDIRHAYCFAHARRFFTDGLKSIGINPKRIPPKPPPQAKRLLKGLNFIRGLYAIEHRIRDRAPDQRLAVRQAESTPALERLYEWVKDLRPKVTPTSDLGKALRYLDEYHQGLTYFVLDGRVEIDNNLCEGAIRPFAIGRNNWKFADTMAGAHSSAALYSLIETAKANRLEPYAYLRYVFHRLPAATCLADVEALLPWNLTPQVLATA